MTIPYLSHGNHFRFGYNGQAFTLRQKSQDKWWVNYGTCTRWPENFRQECLEAARLIRASTDQQIWVLFSGGVDSEVALRSFVESGIDVNAAILRFNGGINEHDISYAFETCKQLNVKSRVFELDLHRFWQNDYQPYAARTRCVSPQLLTTMYLADQVPGYPVIGSGECLLVHENGQWDLWEKEKIASWYRHFLILERAACPGFFQYTPELMLSYLIDPMVVKFIDEIKQGSTADIKLAMYQQHFNLASRPKYTGFENVQPEDYVLRQKLKSQYHDSDAVIKTSYNILIQELTREITARKSC